LLNRIKRIKKSFFLVLVLLATVTSCTKKTVVRKITLRELYSFVDNAISNNRKINQFKMAGYFIYKDDRHDLNLALTLFFDDKMGFRRIVFKGNLDDSYWGDIVVFKGITKIYYPLDDKLFIGKTDKISFKKVNQLNISLKELLQILSCRVFFLDNFSKASGKIEGDKYLLYLKNSDKWQKVYFDSQKKTISRIKLYKGNKEIADIRYSYYKYIDSVLVPHKIQFKSPVANTSCTIWFQEKETNFKYRFKKGNEKIKIAKKTEKIEI